MADLLSRRMIEWYAIAGVVLLLRLSIFTGAWDGEGGSALAGAGFLLVLVLLARNATADSRADGEE